MAGRVSTIGGAAATNQTGDQGTGNNILDNFHGHCKKANTEKTKDGFKVVSHAGFFSRWWNWYSKISVTTVHLSCSSHVYQPDHDYAGFILYAHKGKTDWTLNGVHCKSGYIVVQDSNSEDVKRYIGKAEGQIHGPVYMNVFGEDVGDTIGEAFSLKDGSFVRHSGTFNNRTYEKSEDHKASKYHDDDRSTISEEGVKCLKEVIKEWKRAGVNDKRLPSGRNWKVTELLAM